jgi:serine/threonine protein kinase
VHYLHSQRPPVLHGDIKPENILVSENFQVRVGDFATSRILDNARPSVKDSRFRGTPVYLPPEMFNLNEMGLEGDIYAFGVTAWEVLTEQKGKHRSAYGVCVCLCCARCSSLFSAAGVFGTRPVQHGRT